MLEFSFEIVHWIWWMQSMLKEMNDGHEQGRFPPRRAKKVMTMCLSGAGPVQTRREEEKECDVVGISSITTPSTTTTALWSFRWALRHDIERYIQIIKRSCAWLRRDTRRPKGGFVLLPASSLSSNGTCGIPGRIPWWTLPFCRRECKANTASMSRSFLPVSPRRGTNNEMAQPRFVK